MAVAAYVTVNVTDDLSLATFMFENLTVPKTAPPRELVHNERSTSFQGNIR